MTETTRHLAVADRDGAFGDPVLIGNKEYCVNTRAVETNTQAIGNGLVNPLERGGGEERPVGVAGMSPDGADPISRQCPRRRGTMGSTPSPNQRWP